MSEPKSKNIVWHKTTVSREERESINGHRGATVWLTGLSGSGKSTTANLMEKALWERGCRAFDCIHFVVFGAQTDREQPQQPRIVVND